jgi:DNA-binding phage protein
MRALNQRVVSQGMALFRRDKYQLIESRGCCGNLVSNMTSRKTFRPRESLVGETTLGSHLLVFNDDEVVHLLRAAVEREGNQGAFARRYGIERTGLNQILNGKRPVTSAVLNALGFRKVYAPK